MPSLLLRPEELRSIVDRWYWSEVEAVECLADGRVMAELEMDRIMDGWKNAWEGVAS